MDKQQSLDQQRVTTFTEEHEEKLAKVTESAESTATCAAESVSIKNSCVPLSNPLILIRYVYISLGI